VVGLKPVGAIGAVGAGVMAGWGGVGVAGAGVGVGVIWLTFLEPELPVGVEASDGLNVE